MDSGPVNAVKLIIRIGDPKRAAVASASGSKSAWNLQKCVEERLAIDQQWPGRASVVDPVFDGAAQQALRMPGDAECETWVATGWTITVRQGNRAPAPKNFSTPGSAPVRPVSTQL